jgi:hypothetical protein
MQGISYNRSAGTAAIIAGIGGPLYSVAFVILYVFGVAPDLGFTLASLFLLLGGLLSVVVLIALYFNLREVEPAYAVLGLVLGVAGALGGAAHGAYDLANQLHPPSTDVLGAAGYPNMVDPRGLATFGLAGLGIFFLGQLMSRSPKFPARLGTLAIVFGVLNIVIYLARLIILTPTNPVVLVVAGVTGLVVSPVFYIWVGTRLRAMTS